MNVLHLIAKYGHTNVINPIKRYKNISWKITSSKTGFNALHVATQFGQVTFVITKYTIRYYCSLTIYVMPTFSRKNLREKC